MLEAQVLEGLLDEAVEIAREASARILEVYESDFEVEEKGDRSPLTQADLGANEVITQRLAELRPSFPILSEESSHEPYPARCEWRQYWLVDPLDGTREFVKRNGEFTVNIALIDEHRPVLGVVFVPVGGECYLAADGVGAFKLDTQRRRQRIRVRARPRGRTTVAGSRSHSNDATRDFIERLGEVEMIGIGSSLKICLVAEGRADIYPRFGPTSEWDTGAAQCVVEQAGGHLTDTTLKALRYNIKESLLNPHFLVFGDDSQDWLQYMQES